MAQENGLPSWDELSRTPPGGVQSARRPSGLTATPAPAPEPGWGDWLQGLGDRAGLALGVLDPAEYRGRNPDGSLVTAEQGAQRPTTISAPPPQTLWDRVANRAAESASAAGTGEVGALIRHATDAFNLDDAFQAQQFPGMSAAEREAMRDTQMRDQVLGEREARARAAAADPIVRAGEAWFSPGSIARFGADLIGDTAGNANPTYLIGGPGGLLSRMVTQGGINAGIDAAVQGSELGEGLREEFDPLQTAIQFGAGAGLEGVGSMVRRMWRGTPSEPGADIPDLQDVTLDGGPAGAVPDVEATLNSAGYRSDMFSTPELAAQMAERIAAARGRTPNIAPEILAERENLTRGIEVGDVDPSLAPPPIEELSRTVPPGVVMSNSPEFGTARSDDLGSMIATLRYLAGRENVLEQGQARAAEDPLIAQILNSTASMDQQVGTIWRRIAEMDAERRTPPPGTAPLDPNAPNVPPMQRSTVEAARGENDGAFLPTRGRISSRFGGREAPTKGASTNHGGIDIAAPRGSPVAAPSGGTVIMAGEAGPNGNLVRVDHGNGVVSSYAHLDSINVRIGQQVNPGDLLGGVGSTGRSTGNHLHYGIRVNGKAVDPETFRFGRDAPAEPIWQAGERQEDIFDTAGGFERQRAQRSPTQEELEAGKVFEQPGGIFTAGPGGRQFEGPMATRGTEPRKMGTDDPDQAPPGHRWQDERGDGPQPAPDSPSPGGGPRSGPGSGKGFFEDRARSMMDDLMREYQASRARRQERASQSQSRERDPSDRFKKYGQRPHQEGDFWRQTEDGIIADKDGNPVAFRNAKDAAKWATSNKMAGDFELHTWGTNSERVVLKRRANSTYGEAPPRTEAPAGPAEPAAGRSQDTSQRAIEGPPSSANSPEPETRGGAESPAAPSRSLLDAAVDEASAADPATIDPKRRADLSEYLQSVVDDPVTPEAGERAARALANLQSAKPARAPLTGKSERVVTPTGREVETQFEVRELSDVQQAKGEMQPRDRSRDASDIQVGNIAARLDPEQLHSNRQAAHGSPIITGDGTLATGNGRARAIERAYARHPERAEAYRQMIRDQGFDIEGFERPILVRRMAKDLPAEDMRAFVNEAQDSGTMRYSAPEQAKADAAAISDEGLSLYRGGEPNSAANREFVKRWLKETGADTNAVLAKDGTLSPEGTRRVQASVLSRAFDDETLIGKLLGDADNNIKAIGNALVDAAPKFAQVRAMVRAGELPAEFDISGKVAEMAGLISRAREEGHKIGDLLGQSDMFGKNVDAATESLVRLMFKDVELTRPRSQVRLKEAFDFYLEDAKAQAQGKGMFGDEIPDLRPVDILEAARAKMDAKDSPPGQGTFYKLVERGSGGRSSERSLKAELRAVRADADPEQRELIDRLLDLIDDDARLSYGRLGSREDGKVIAGEADLEANRVFVGREGDLETLLHEAEHLARQRRYGEEFDELRPGDAGVGPARELIRLYNDARRRYGKYGNWNRKSAGHTVEYALSSIDEFLAEAASSPAFQRWLQRGTLWDRLVDGFRKVLGLPARFKPILEDVLRAQSALHRAARADPVRVGTSRSAPIAQTGGFGRKGVVQKIVDKDGLTRDAERLREAIGDPGKALSAIGRRIKDGAGWLMFSNDGRGRMVADRIESDAAHELLDHFFARPGMMDGKTVGRTYHEAVQRYGNGRAQAAFRALEGITGNKASERRVADLLRFPNRKSKATAAEIEAAKSLRELFKETLEYRKAAGEEIGEVTDGYMPRWLDVERVLSDPDEFKARAVKLYRGLGMDGREAEAQAQAWLEHTIDTYAGLDAGLDLFNAAGDTVGTRTAQARQFGKEADALLADFYQDDLLAVASQYFHGSARKAEMARRFGPKGAVGSAERAKWIEQHGDKTQLAVLEERIREDARGHGADGAHAMGVLRGIYSSNLGRLRSNMSARQRAAVAWAHTWTQLGVMDRATLTSLAELAAGFTRGGVRHGLPFVRDSFKYYVRELRRAPPDDAQRWAEAVGVAQDALVNTALTARASIEGGTEKSQKVLQGFYEATTLHQYTEGTRVAAVKLGRELLSQWAHDMASKSPRVANRAKKFLAEVGIGDPDAFARRIRDGGISLEDVSRDASAAASEYATALIRLSNQMIMRPTRAEKPAWASHPIGSMFFSLMAYNYGFKKNVLDRTGRLLKEAWKDKDPTLLQPALGLAIMTGIQATMDTYVRPAIFGGGPPDDETPIEAGLRVADRAGLVGGLSPLINAMTGVKYQRGLSESLAGPVIGRPLDMGTKFVAVGVNNSPRTNTAERNAAGAVYDNVIEPGLDGLAAARLLGPARTAAVMGTGTRTDDGALPSDREAFISAVVGPKKKKGG